MVYQFSLPPLLLHAMETGDAGYLCRWAANLQPPPPGCTFFNFTASHDGIGLRPLEGLLPDDELSALAESMEQKGGRVSWRANPDGTETPYELNITYFDALSLPGRRDSDLCVARFLCSQTIMLSLQGIPGIYFNSLIAAPNWLAGVQETGRARTINRQKWSAVELEGLLDDPAQPASRVFPEYLRRLRIRGKQAAFHPDGRQETLRLPAGLFGVKRTAPDHSEELWVIANVTRHAVNLRPTRIDRRYRQRRWTELLQGWGVDGPDLGELQLAPYQVLWLTGSEFEPAD
jgi:sucrose phosphorylase